MFDVGRHFRQDASLLGVVLAYAGTGAAAALAFYVFGDVPGEPLHDADIGLAGGAVVFGGVPGLLVLAYLTLRPLPSANAAASRCEVCGARGALTDVRAVRVGGLAVVVWMRQLAMRCCRGCALRAHGHAALYCCVLGPWSLSAFAIPLLVLHAGLGSLRALMTTSSSSHARRLLDDEWPYAQRLLATKPFETVVEVLADKTGLAPDTVAQYMRDRAD